MLVVGQKSTEIADFGRASGQRGGIRQRHQLLHARGDRCVHRLVGDLPVRIQLRAREQVRADVTNRMLIVRNTSESGACVCAAPLGEALIKRTGLWIGSTAETSQSSAFLSEPGMPCAYSGVAITSPSTAPMAARSAATGSGSGSTSRSGLKC